MLLKIFNKTPEQYRKLLNYLASGENVVQKGLTIEDTVSGAKASIPGKLIAYIHNVELHRERDGGGYGNLDISISIPVQYLGPDGKNKPVPRKIINGIFDITETFDE